MDIKQLKYFIEVANTQNLSRAAENLYISQPTLSLSMKKIEKELNTQIFGAESKYGLTPAGQLLYDKGSEIVRSFDRLVDEMEKFGSDKNQTIRLGITILFAVQYMQQISSFIARHQHVNLHIIQNGSINIQKQLAKGDVDLAIVSLPNLHPGEIECEKLDSKSHGYHVGVVMSNSNPLALRDSLNMEDLKDQRFSTLTDEFMIGDLLKRRSREVGFKPNIVMNHEDLQVLLHSIGELDSVCLMPMEYRRLNDMPQLTWVPLKDEKAFFDVAIAKRKDTQVTPEMQEFIDEIKEY